MPIGDRDEITQRQQQRQQVIPAQQGARFQTGAAAGDGVGLSADFLKLYKETEAKRAEMEAKRREDESGREEATPLDDVIKTFLDVGKASMGFGQDAFREQRENGGLLRNPVGTLASLAATLPGSIVGAPTYGMGQWGEVFTGRDVQSMDDDHTISAKRLTPEQRAWESVDATVNTAGGLIGAEARVLGAGAKALSKRLSKSGSDVAKKAGDVIERAMPNEGRGLVSKEVGAAGLGRAAQIGGQLAFDSASEGAEEFIQTFAEHGRAGDEFTSDTLDEAFESAAYGAIGGSMMSGAGLALNEFVDRRSNAQQEMEQKKNKQQADMSKPDASGLPVMRPVAEEDKVSTRQFVPTAAMAYDTTVTKKATKTENIGGLTVASNPEGIDVDDLWMGVEALRAQWKASGREGRDNIKEMLQIDDDDMVQNALDAEDYDTLNANLNKHSDYNVRQLKREPGLTDTTIHNVWVTKIIPGAASQVHPMTSQLGNGDIDADKKTPMNLPHHDFLFPSQLFLNPDGTSTDFDLKFLPNLDANEARRQLRRELAYALEPLVPVIGKNNVDRHVRRISASASRAKMDADGAYGNSHPWSSRFMNDMNDLANTARSVAKQSNLDENAVNSVVSNAVNGVMQAMYRTVTSEESLKSVLMTQIEIASDQTEEVVQNQVNEVESLDTLRRSSGSVGRSTTFAAIAQAIGMPTSLAVGTRPGASLRSGQTLKYNIAAKVNKLSGLDEVLRDANTDSIEKTVANIMKLVTIGEHMNENITELFNNMLLMRFMRLLELDRGGQANYSMKLSDIDLFIEARNDLVVQFNKSIKKEFHTGVESVIGSIEKHELDKDSASDRELAAGHMASMLKNFQWTDFFDVPNGSRTDGMYFGDVISMLAQEDVEDPVVGHIGSDPAKLVGMMVRQERASFQKVSDQVMRDNSMLPRLGSDDLSNPREYGRAMLVLDAIVHVLDPVVCLEENLYEVYTAMESEYGWSAFMGRPSDIANVQVTASLKVAYRDVVNAFEMYKEKGDEKYLKTAVAYAAELRGDSILSKAIHAELNESGTTKLLDYLCNIDNSYEDKVFQLESACKAKGFRVEPLLASALSITQPEFDVVSSRVRENRRTVSQVTEKAMEDSRKECETLIHTLKSMPKADQFNVMSVLKDFVVDNAYEPNDELFAAVVADSTTIHLKDDEKGQNIDSAIMYFQQMQMQMLGGPVSLSSEMQDMTVGAMSVQQFLGNKKAWIDVLFNGGKMYLYSGAGADVEPITLATLLKDGPHGPNGTMSINDLQELLENYPQLIRLLEPHKMTPSITNEENGGTAQRGTERSLGHFTNRFKNYMDSRGRIQSVDKQKEKNRLEWALMNDERFPVLVSAFLEINDDGTVDRDEIIRKKNALVEAIYQIIGRINSVDDVDVESVLINSGLARMGEDISGRSRDVWMQFSDIARSIANGSSSFVFSVDYISEILKKQAVNTVMESMDYETKSTLSSWMIGEDSGVMDSGQLSAAISIMCDSYKDAAKTMVGANDIAVDVNCTAFAMLGSDRMKSVMKRSLFNMVRHDRIPIDAQADVEKMIDQAVSSACDYLINGQNDAITTEDFSLEGLEIDEIMSKRDEIEAKFYKLVDDPRYRISPETQNNMHSNMSKIWNELKSGDIGVDKFKSKLERLRLSADNLVMMRAVRHISSYTDASVNEFFMEDMFEISNALEGLIQEMRDPSLGINVTQHSQDLRSEDIVLPELKISNPKNAFVAIMSGRHVSEGQIGVDVGVNGFVLNNSLGLSLIPHINICNAEARSEGLLSSFDFMSHLEETVIVRYGNEGSYMTIVSESFDKTRKNILEKDPNAEVLLFDEDSCTCPFCKNHYGGTHNKFSKGYLKTTSAFFRLVAWAQEQKNLKLKKALKIAGKVIKENKFDPIFREDEDVSGLDMEALFEIAKNKRKNLKKELVEKYSVVLRSYDAFEDIDESIVDVMASVNSSVFVLTGETGERCFASLYELNDKRAYEEIVEKIGAISKIRSHPVSYEQINAKIEREVLAGLDGNSDFSKEVTDKLAWNAVTEWREYGTRSEPVDYIMSMLPIYSISGPSNIVPAGHLTAEQLFRGRLNADGTVKKRFKQRPDSVDVEEDDSIVKKNREFQRRSSIPLDYLVTSFEDMDKGYPPDMEMFQLAKNSLNPKDKFYSGYPSAVIIRDHGMTKESMLGMIEEGYKGFRYVIVPYTENVRDVLTDKRVMAQFEETKVFGEDFAVVDLESSHDFYYRDDRITFGEGYFTLENVVFAFYDENGVYNLGDGPIKVNDHMAENVRDYFVDDIAVSLDALPNDGLEYKVVPRNELKDVCKNVLDGKAMMFYPKIERINDVEEDASRWMKRIANDSFDMNLFDEKGFIRGSVARNTPFAIISTRAADGSEYYMPAYATGSIPDVIDEITGFGYDSSSGDFLFYQSTLRKFDESTDLKGTQSGEASKGMMARWKNGDLPMPVLANVLSNVKNIAVFNQNTRIGRILGSSEKLLKESVYLLSKSVPTHFAFTALPGGGVEVNKNLNYNTGRTDSLTAEEIDRLTADYNYRPLLKSIANGTKNLFLDEESNLVVRRLAAECLSGNGVTFSNILCPYKSTHRFSEVVNDENLRKDVSLFLNRVSPRQINGVLRRFTFVEMQTFYNRMNNRICPDPYNSNGGDDGVQPVMDMNGNILCTITTKDGKKITGYFPARLSHMTYMDLDTRVGEKEVNSSLSMQQRIGYALRNGVSPADVKLIVDAIRIKNADASGYLRDVHEPAKKVLSNYDPRHNLVDLDWLRTYSGNSYLRQVKAQEDTFKAKIKIKDGKDIVNDPMDSERFRNLFDRFKRALAGDNGEPDNVHVSKELFLNVIAKPVYGWSYSDGEGIDAIPIEAISEGTNEFISNLKGRNEYLFEGRARGVGNNTRISFGMIPRNVAMQLWEVSLAVREKFGSIGKFEESMQKQQSKTVDDISTFCTTGRGKSAERIAKKRDALWLLNAYIQRTWGYDVPNSILLSNAVEQDYEDSMRMAVSGLFDVVPEEVERMIAQSKESRRQAIESARRANKRGLVSVDIDEAPGGKVYMEKNTRKTMHQKALNGSVTLMRVMGMLDPAILLGNIYEGVTRGAIQDFATMLPGTFFPWGKDKRTMNDKDLKKLAENKDLQQMVKMMRETALNGDLDAFILGMQEDGATWQSVAEKLYGEGGKQKILDRIFSFTAADTMMLEQQTYRMLKFLDTYITQGDFPALMRKDQNGVTQLELNLKSDVTAAFTNMLSVDSPVRTEVLRAVNTSDTFSMSQRNAVSIIIEHFTQKSSVANLAVATTITPFIRYFTNIHGARLNWFMPISSLNYVMVEQMSKFDSLRDMGVEQAQVYDSFRSALIVDATHMAFPAVAAILISLGLIQPPPDDDKKCNYQEYLFAGRRIAEDYVLTDLTGPILPYACFMKMAMSGEPRFDVLFNGMSDILANNPLMKLGDIVDTVVSPDQIVEDMEDEAMGYEDTLYGQPNLYDQMSGSMIATLTALAGKIVTPAFIRNMGKAYQYESSYKRVWEQNDESVNVGTGELTDTVRVDYDEAMLRKITRDNPLLGVIWNFLRRPDTSYTPLTTLGGAKRDMTPVVYLDPYQRYIRDQYSIYYRDDEGEYHEKSEEDKQATALNIIATLQSYSDMEELYNSGFIIDSSTRRYVGDVVWQTVKQLQLEFYNWKNSEEADAYLLGGGDFLAGQAIIQETRNRMDKNVEYWKDFYSNKLNSEPMRRGIQQYMRENVQYMQDVNGDWYASGFGRGMNPAEYITGFKAAPGTIESPFGTTDDGQGTMGYEGDWTTPSAVVEGMSTFERALHAVPVDRDEFVPFDDLAENNPELAEAVEKAKNGTYGSRASSGGRYYSRGGGGGGRSGGGGGGTNLYSRPGSVNVPYARTISASRPYDSRFDYLRPGFETKGSREASRRSDF